jgi:transcriptional regulator with XRE-family HTH domain
MGIKKELGKKIKKFRISKGYTQEKLSEMIDISQKALSSIEIGENFVSAETFDKLVKALDTTAEELFATNSFKDTKELLRLINENIAKISDNSEKLEIVYNLTTSLARK